MKRRMFAPTRSINQGFALFETVLAMVILAGLLATVGPSLARKYQFGREVHERVIANNIARNEIEMLRAAGPKNADNYVGERRTNAAGEPVTGGPFKVTVAKSISCSGGTTLNDNSRETNDIDPSTCTSTGRDPVLVYSIEVEFRGHTGPEIVKYSMTLSDESRFGDVKADVS